MVTLRKTNTPGIFKFQTWKPNVDRSLLWIAMWIKKKRFWKMINKVTNCSNFLNDKTFWYNLNECGTEEGMFSFSFFIYIRIAARDFCKKLCQNKFIEWSRGAGVFVSRASLLQHWLAVAIMENERIGSIFGDCKYEFIQNLTML